jgi:hypothetical protein
MDRQGPGQDLVRGGRQTRAMIVAAIMFLSQLLSAQSNKPVRRILIFNDFSYISSPGIANIDQAIAPV